MMRIESRVQKHLPSTTTNAITQLFLHLQSNMNECESIKTMELNDARISFGHIFSFLFVCVPEMRYDAEQNTLKFDVNVTLQPEPLYDIIEFSISKWNLIHNSY